MELCKPTTCFATQGYERLTILGNGKIGINTDNPSQILTVRGTILKTRSDSGLGLIYLTNDASNNGIIDVNQNSGVTRIKLNSAGESYFNGGNLAVGSTSSSGWKFRVQVSANASYQSAANITNNTNADLQFEIKNSESRFGPSTNTPLVFKTNNTEKVRIAADGELLVGGHSARIQTYSSSGGTLISSYNTGANGGGIELCGNTNSNGYNAGSIFFVNNTNSNASALANANSKIVGMVRAEIVTSDSNAGDDCGADIVFFTKPEAGNVGERIRIKGNGDVYIQGASNKDFLWDESDSSLYLTDTGSGSSARLKVGSGGDLQLYHDTTGTNHITCANNGELKVSANKLRVFDYTGVTEYFTVQSDKVMVHKDLKSSTNNTLDIGANGAKFRRAFATHFVHRTGSSSGVGQNESEAIYISGGLHFFHDYVTLSTSNFTHGLTSNRSYDVLRLRNSGSGSAIYAENGSISSGSDYRMKENVAPITGAIDMVKNLKPCTYNIKKSFNEHDAGGTHQGFIAHEVQEAIPNIVNIVQGTKDAMEEVRYMEEDDIPEGKSPGDGTGVFTDKPDMQGIDYGHMTPILTAALKEAIAKIETLESKVESIQAQQANDAAYEVKIDKLIDYFKL